MALDARDRVAVLDGGKVTVGRQVDAVTAATVDRYVNAWAQVRDDLVESAADAARIAQDRGEPRNPAAYRTARLQGVLAQLTTDLKRLGMQTGVAVTDLVGPVVAVPQQVLAELQVAGAPAFARTPTGELGAIIRRQQEAIASRYLVLSGEAEQGMRDALLQGVARGSGTDEVARGMVRRSQAATAARLGIGSAAELEGAAASIVAQVRQAFAGGLQRATNLARTELIDASRVATTASYLANPGVVQGWEWMATLDRRTCPACWGMHGQVFAPDVHQEGHQQCRCTQSPLLTGERPGENGLQDRDAAFKAMPREEQLQVLGPQRLAAYEAGVSLDAMAQRRDANGAWRASYGVTPLRDLPKPG